MTWRVFQQIASGAGQGWFAVLRDEHGQKLAGYYKRKLLKGTIFTGRWGPLMGADSAWMEDGYEPDQRAHERYRDDNKAVLMPPRIDGTKRHA